jgi:hypothetical protein
MPPHLLPSDGKPVHPFAAKGANLRAAWYISILWFFMRTT